MKKEVVISEKGRAFCAFPQSERAKIFTLRSGERVKVVPGSKIVEPIYSFLPFIFQRIVGGSKNYIEWEMDFKRTVGKSHIVEVTPEDTVVYYRQRGSQIYSKIVLREACVYTSWITVRLIRDRKEPKDFIILSAFFGRKVPTEPGYPGANMQSWDFWVNHAYAWGTVDLQLDLRTKHCPWPLPLHEQQEKPVKRSGDI